MSDFTLPELGENIETGDVLRVLVQPGDTVSKDQPVLELETDKATIEVPSSVAGRVTDVKVKAGDKVRVGQPILSVQESGATSQVGSAPPAEETGQQPKRSASNEKSDSGEEMPEEGALEQHVEARQPGKADKPGVADSAEEHAGAQEDQAEEVAASGSRSRGSGGGAEKVVDFSRGRVTTEAPAAPELPPAPAAPSVRRMARELGVDINDVPGTGHGGRISSDDVKAHVSRLVTGDAAHSAAGVLSLPDFSRWGEVERRPMSAIRRKTAAHLAAAWTAIPHVTQHDLADITALEDLRKRYTKSVEKAGGHLTVTAIAVKIVAAALKVFPQFNASIDLAAVEIVYKKYVNIGVAVDTDRGLLVPVIRDADTKNITDVAIELTDLAERARNRKLTLEEMQGGCFSVSNLGGIGGTAFTPIVNAPEVAILGISRARIEPVWRPVNGHAHAADDREPDGQFVPRTMLPLSLSYDHRAIDGAEGARFLRWVVEALEQPFLLSLQG